jgi:hypothetical protein
LDTDLEQERCDALAPKLYDAIADILAKMFVNAHISYPIVEEVIIHFWRDLERLYAIHHELVHVTKACSYIAFWVRKLKPISDAYPNSIIDALAEDSLPPHFAEITDINEQVAIHLSIRLLRNCIRDHRIIDKPDIKKSEILNSFDTVVDDYLTSEIEDGMSMGLRFESMIYDMRFRTYGPHHLTHFLTHIIRDVYKECEKLQTR